jgi:L-amino acid N-acyltransferase YncA
MNRLSVRPALPADGEAIARIYNHYIQNTVITFEEEPVSARTMVARVAEVKAHRYHGWWRISMA